MKKNYSIFRREYLISYDIEDNKIRRIIYKEMSRYGIRAVQKSVFWGYLNKGELSALKRFLTEKLMDNDKAFIAPSDFKSVNRSFLFGHSQDDFIEWKESDVI